MNTPHNMVTLVRVGKNHEATLLAGQLRAHGIRAQAEQLLALDEFTTAQLSMGNGGIRVWVPREQLEQAKAVLAELEAARGTISADELERQAMEAGNEEPQ